jgi:hypothetical protein
MRTFVEGPRGTRVQRRPSRSILRGGVRPFLEQP